MSSSSLPAPLLAPAPLTAPLLAPAPLPALLPAPAPCGAPLLEAASGDSILVRYAAPPRSTWVRVHLREAGGPWKTFDSRKSTLLALPAQRVQQCKAQAGKVTIPGLDPQKKYEVRIKAKNSVGVSEEWSPIAQLQLAAHAPAAPCAATLEPESRDSIRVVYAAPPGCSRVKVQVYEAGGSWMTFNPTTNNLVQDRPDIVGCLTSAGQCTIPGLDLKKTYHVRLKAKNHIAWSANWSPTSRLRLASHLPAAPCAPLLEATSRGDGIRVWFAAPPACGNIKVQMREAGGPWKVFCRKTPTLVALPAESYWPCKASDGKCTIRGLDLQNTFEVRVKGKNSVGFSEHWSPISKLTPAAPAADDAVEIVGARTWEERDSALREQAVEVDDEDDEDDAVVQQPAPADEGAAAAGAKRPAEVIDLDATTGHEQPRAKRVRPSSTEREMRRLA